ncbi:hypothetical protein P2R12_20715 [Cytobacillus oceanisediminis]|uniref:hypothetical protein n=1 Tax=Cytobacillus oceanisediminis TaxID=665099 RepID=UPI0023D9D604|nr:hypothetical protein [Cytobacillus oceanisediminis]MDF2039359.1 hypothetical protein [Cytobacillus oceanisediminis]
MINRGTVKDIDLNEFFTFLSKLTKDNIEPKFDITHVTISHLSPRLSLESIVNEPLYNLSNVLTNDTELSRFLKKAGLVFSNNNKIVQVTHNDMKIDWKKYESPTALMIINRLEGNKVSTTSDNCINGFLFNGKIFENGNVAHIFRCPEILENILRVLGRLDLISNFNSKSKPYIICFKAPISDIIFDGNGNHKLNNKEKQFLILRYCLYYLSLQKSYDWSGNNNPIIRLKDNLDVDISNLVAVFEVNEEDGELNQLSIYE